MIIIMRRSATQADIDHVIDRIKELEFGVHLSQGEERTIIGAIGDERHFDSIEAQDAFDLEALYAALENEVLPEWCTRDAHGRPAAWLQRVRRCILTCAPLFTSHRMVRDYALTMYAPACTEPGAP